MNLADAYLLYLIATFALVLGGIGAWLADRAARPAERASRPAGRACRPVERASRPTDGASPVWVFNNIPAASRVDTEASAKAAVARSGGAA